MSNLGLFSDDPVDPDQVTGSWKEDYDWLEAFKYADSPNSVPLRETNVSRKGFTIDDVVQVIAAQCGRNDEDPWIMVGLLRDFRYFVLEAGCDYTGWDCQASGSATVADNFGALVRLGLTKEERELFSFPLDGSIAYSPYDFAWDRQHQDPDRELLWRDLEFVPPKGEPYVYSPAFSSCSTGVFTTPTPEAIPVPKPKGPEYMSRTLRSPVEVFSTYPTPQKLLKLLSLVFPNREFPRLHDYDYVAVIENSASLPVAVAFATWTDEPDEGSDAGRVRLSWVAVCPDYQGCGLGAQVLRTLMDFFMAMDSHVKFEVKLNPPSPAKTAFYETLGFRKMERDEK